MYLVNKLIKNKENNGNFPISDNDAPNYNNDVEEVIF